MSNRNADISRYDAPLVIGISVICAILWFVATKVSM